MTSSFRSEAREILDQYEPDPGVRIEREEDEQLLSPEQTLDALQALRDRDALELIGPDEDADDSTASYLVVNARNALRAELRQKLTKKESE